MKRILWVSQHQMHPSQLGALRRLFGADVRVEHDPQPFDNAETIIRRVKSGGYDDCIVVAPFSVRPLAGAPVSTPLEWDEVEPGLDPKRFTIKTVIPRLERSGDALRPVLTAAPDLAAAIARLGARFDRGAG